MSKLRANKVIRTINKGIAKNPTEITFSKKIRKIVDGAFQTNTDNATITVLIYLDDGSNQANINSGTQGTSYSSSRFKMIADKDANLEVNPKEKVKFENNGMKFEIKAVYPLIAEDIICGYMCDLERID
ncbi:hypothetical protein [Candidatus Clostridium helianthi]|uniref:Uncharacterized protein n=1 Tax=Candidatus Clostridium helianthi TaxID=3381660 RepID=A0ABW8S433_9CLOT